MYGRYFVDLELHFPGKEGIIAAKLMLRSLAVDGPSISKQEMETFQTRILANLEGEFTERLHALDKDPYFNALQAKYAYCVTCHKAQGGQWKHVYIDMSGIDTEALDDSFYRWLYTAITRATEKIFLINPTLSIK
jgi:exodeoxyribonuclease-5